MASEYYCSPLNYIGGKYKLLPQIMPLFPKGINTFVDLFCGGCNVGINASANNYIFNDNLVYLIDLYKVFLSTSLDKIIEHIEQRIIDYNLSLTNKDGYVLLRNKYNTDRFPLDLFVLIAFSFNHQIRFNNSHQYNNPFGKERSSFNNRMKNNLIMFVERLKSINPKFIASNFDEIDLSALTQNDFVYADPPYLITTGTYNDGKRGFTGWSITQERALLELLSRLNENGVSFALSNVLSHKGKINETLIDWVQNNNFLIHNLCKDYKNSNYHTINSDVPTTEVLITNYQL